MDQETVSTYFAPPERAPAGKVAEERGVFAGKGLLDKALGVVPDIIMILNGQRQIIYANKTLTELLGRGDRLYGLRPGEALDCVHAVEMAAGCGTSVFCRECGAARAILESQAGREACGECRVSRLDGKEPLDLRVWAMPLKEEGESFTFFAVTDISNEKRRKVLERIFFHDALNTAGGISGLAQITELSGNAEIDNNVQLIRGAADALIQEIEEQRQLLAAENGYLAIRQRPANSLRLLKDAQALFARHEVAKGKRLELEPDAADIDFATDDTLLRRVLGNMVKNALEASVAGDLVTLGCHLEPDGGHVTFSVRNPEPMPEHVQHQVFQRSFSTKGEGRGIGTYSMKLLGETYLGGKVGFECAHDDGTRFWITLPLASMSAMDIETLPSVDAKPESHPLEELLESFAAQRDKISEPRKLRAELETLLAKHRQVGETMLVSQIGVFGGELKALGETHRCAALADYGDRLLALADRFEIAALAAWFALFPDFAKAASQRLVA